MKDDARPPLSKYAKYLPEYEPTPRVAAPVTNTLPQPGSYLKAISIMLGILSIVVWVYLLWGLTLAPTNQYSSLGVFFALVFLLPVAVLSEVIALICWAIYSARTSRQS